MKMRSFSKPYILLWNIFVMVMPSFCSHCFSFAFLFLMFLVCLQSVKICLCVSLCTISGMVARSLLSTWLPETHQLIKTYPASAFSLFTWLLVPLCASINSSSVITARFFWSCLSVHKLQVMVSMCFIKPTSSNSSLPAMPPAKPLCSLCSFPLQPAENLDPAVWCPVCAAWPVRASSLLVAQSPHSLNRQHTLPTATQD